MRQAWQEHISPLLWAVQAFGRPLGWLGLGWLCIGILSSALMAFQPWLLKLVIDGLSQDRVMIAPVVLLGAMLFVPRVLSPIEVLLRSRIVRRTMRIQDEFRMELGAALPDMGRLDDPDYRRLIGRLNAADLRVVMLVEHAGTAAARIVGFAILGVSAATVIWWLGPVLVIAVLPLVIAHYRMHRNLWSATIAETDNFVEAEYCTRLAAEPASAQEIRTLRIGKWLRDRQKRHLDSALGAAGKARLRGTPPSLGWAAVYALLTGGGIWLAISRLGIDTSAGDVALLLTVTFALSAQLGELMRLVSGLLQGGREVQTFHDVAEQTAPSIEVTSDGAKAPRRYRQGLELADVVFGYQSSAPVIRGLDLRLRSGETVALVGENGAGKSTLVRLLTRMNQPTSGSIVIDGLPIESYDLMSLRSGMAAAFQDAARFSMTVRDNVAITTPDVFGMRSNPDHDKAVQAALRAGGAERVVAGLAHGLDTELTSRFGGVELSGGQWQRIATARAFLPDAALIVVDEPTAALDVDGERQLFESFADLTRGRTALIISHRLSGARRADRIAFISEGRVAEFGTHDELMSLGGRYAELFRMQAAAFDRI